MKLVEFVDGDGSHFFDPLAVVYVGPLISYIDLPDLTEFKVIYMGGEANLTGDRDEFVRLVQKKREV